MRLDEATRARLRARLARLYGDTTADRVLPRLLTVLERHEGGRWHAPREELWDEHDAILITYADSVLSTSEIPLRTLRAFVSGHLSEAFTTLHILPFFPYSSDDGFSVTDFRSVREDLGDWPDVQAIADKMHLMVDLILNHVSRESLWFTDFVNRRSPGCDYFIEVEPKENLTAVVRPRSTPLLSGVRTPDGMRHVWATFSNDQIDLNYSNPDVLLEFVDILLFYISQGARILRLDAVAFVWKEIGTPCIHLPETHEIVKLLRDVVTAVEPCCLLLSETNVPNEENLSYFGTGDEAHMVYQFSLPPLVLHALSTGSTCYLNEWAGNLPSPPPGCTYLNFTASHDGVGLRPLEDVLPSEEIHHLLEHMRQRGGYISTRRNRDGSDIPYELNISYFDACAVPGAASPDEQIERFLLTQTLALSLQGVPAVYIHSLTATPNDRIGVERTGHTRAINRRKWDKLELERELANPDSSTHRVFQEYLRRLQLRRSIPAFHPDASQRLIEVDDESFALLRESIDGGEQLLAVYNFAPRPRRLRLPDGAPLFGDRAEELLSGRRISSLRHGIDMSAYACAWFRLRPATAPTDD
jgi:sucrose phosphorylase